MAITVSPIEAFDDNYIWCIHDDESAWVVDPGSAESTSDYLNQHGLQLKGILITHHHHDHTGGIHQLSQQNPKLCVIGPASAKISGLTQEVIEGDTIVLAALGLVFKVIELPGHTLDHIGFVNEDSLVCGDTLFSGGCGRLFEGTPQQLYNSLQRLAKLPEQTKVYCTHEYTCANLLFAKMVEPDNQDLLQYQQWCKTQRQQQLPTLPSSIGTEQAINPFLRCDQTSVINSLERNSQSPLVDNVSRFAALRRWKDIA